VINFCIALLGAKTMTDAFEEIVGKDHSPSILSLLGRKKAGAIEDYCFIGSAFPPPEGLVKDFCKQSPYLFGHYPSENYSVRKKFSKAFGIPFNQIVAGNGSTELITLLGRLFIKKVTIPVPTFSEYELTVRNNGKKINHYQLDKENEFGFDRENFVKSVKKSGSNSVLVINPNNPTATLVEKEDLQFLLEELSKLDLFLLDESFIDFAAKEPPTFVKVLKKYSNLAIVKSLGKVYCNPGLRLGFMASANEEIIEKIAGSIPEWSVNSFAEFFIDRLPDYQDYFSRKRLEIIRNRKKFVEQLSEVEDIRVFDSKASFVFAEILKDFDSVYLEKELLKKGFYIRACRNKTGVSRKFFRVAIKEAKKNEKLVEAIRSVCKNR